MNRPLLLGLTLVLLVGLAGCSPEAGRTRGAGPGADVGNVGAIAAAAPGSEPARSSNPPAPAPLFSPVPSPSASPSPSPSARP